MVEAKGKGKVFMPTPFGEGVEPQHGGRNPAASERPRVPSSRACRFIVGTAIVARAGKWSLKRPTTEARIKETLHELSQRHGIKLFEFVNGGDQLHLLMRAKSRPGFQAFLRAFAGLTARLVTGAKKGKPAGKSGTR